MWKKLTVACALSGLCAGVMAAPTGWYELGLTWRDGVFTGKIYYDAASPYQVTQVQGTLQDSAQQTAIGDVWNVSNAAPVGEDFPLNFSNWSDPADPLNYNASFYLALQDLGGSLGVLNLPGTALGLYDWSNPDLFTEEALSNSPLLTWRIAAVNPVPEPAGAALLAAGAVGLGLARRRKRAPHARTASQFA
jgi:hypothetical protein